MPLVPGTRLGPYEVMAPLGAGGMGEVWRARDTRLGREVAIKVLPEAFAADPALRGRFEREAKTISRSASAVEDGPPPRTNIDLALDWTKLPRVK